MSLATVIKPLPAPWTVGGIKATEVEMRPPTLDDLIVAETEAHPGSNPNAFNRALACQQLVRAGSFTGPFAPGQFKGMRLPIWYAIRAAMEAADALGEDAPGSQEPAT